MATVMIQIRNVPKDIHRTLKIRAARADMSLSEYLLAELRRFAERPTREELLERLSQRGSFKPLPRGLIAKVIREARDAGAHR